jgi:hypothetical protein
MAALDAQARWRLHLEPFFGPLRARQIAGHWVDKYIYKRQQSGAANTRINRDLEY